MCTPSSKPLRWTIAVATNNGVDIDVHLGHAKRFAIYELQESGTRSLIEERTVAPDSRLNFHDPEALANWFSGVDIVFANQAGPGAVRSFSQKAIRVFTVSGSIDRALTSYARRGRILEPPIGRNGNTSSAGLCGGAGVGCGQAGAASSSGNGTHGGEEGGPACKRTHEEQPFDQLAAGWIGHRRGLA